MYACSKGRLDGAVLALNEEGRYVSRVLIVGVRGIPNRYGGFERFVEVLAPWLALRGHDVTVFCETAKGEGVADGQDSWRGVRRRFIKVGAPGSLATVLYDLSAFRAAKRGDVVLVFGYGTALFQGLLRLKGVPHAVNMDGIEWRRQKWGPLARAWLRMNEWLASRLATELIADHPEIQREVSDRLGRTSRMIAYGVDSPLNLGRDSETLGRLWLTSTAFDLVIARPEPENQIHCILSAWRAGRRARPMVVVGKFSGNKYGRALMRDFPEVRFVGPIYDHDALNVLRGRSTLYLHGHSVGGTNPSLIEAMAAGAVVVAHDNPYNRWVLDNGGMYFGDAAQLAAVIDAPLPSDGNEALRQRAREICAQRFSWGSILSQYEDLVEALNGSGAR